MSIKIAEAHKRCKICKNYRAQRYCPRKGKDICWLCCNAMRTDRKCPRECAYLIRSDEAESFADTRLKAKVDSMQELRDLTKRLFDRWSESPSDIFNGRVPVDMTESEEGKKELQGYLSRIEDLKILPAGYIARKLNLALPAKGEAEKDYEYSAEQYLRKLMAYDWEGSLAYMYGNNKYRDELFKNNYLIRRSGNRLLKAISSYYMMFSAISENREEALVYYEINSKYDLTMILSLTRDKEWLIKELIIGSPSFYYGEREAIVLISNFISQQEMSKAKQYLDKYKEILIDSADLNYLNGLYCLLTKDYSSALKYYLTAVEIDPDFYEYKYNLALVYQMLQSYDVAKKLYNQLLGKKSDDINVLNNLAVISEAEGNEKEALSLLQKCLEHDPSCDLAQKNIERLKKKK